LLRDERLRAGMQPVPERVEMFRFGGRAIVGELLRGGEGSSDAPACLGDRRGGPSGQSRCPD